MNSILRIPKDLVIDVNIVKKSFTMMIIKWYLIHCVINWWIVNANYSIIINKKMSVLPVAKVLFWNANKLCINNLKEKLKKYQLACSKLK